MHPTTPTRLRLFCFPYAGGSSAVYRGWQERLGPDVEVCAVELPGRGSRFDEPAVADLGALVERLADELAPRLDRPYAFFGHSVGALVAFELSHCLQRRGLALPRWLLLAAKAAPQFFNPEERERHRLPDAEFKKMLSKMGGTPDSILESDEIMHLFLPVLRADFALWETYVHTPRAPLPTSLFLFGGNRDTVPREHLLGWSDHAAAYAGCEWHDGEHFFVHSHAEQLQTRIRALLLAA